MSPPILRESWRIVCLAVLLGLGWGLVEASYLFLTRYHVHAAHQPASGGNLLVAALFNYGLIGLSIGVAGALLRLTMGLRRGHHRMPEVPFLLAIGVAILGGVQAARTVRRALQGLPRDHPLLWLALAGVVAAAAWLGVVSYRAFVRLDHRIGARARRRALAAALALPAILTAAGLVLIGLRVGGVLPLPVAPGLSFPVARDGGTTGEQPNIILLTIETTRADHVNALGYRARQTTPHLDRLAGSGVLFSRAYAQAPWTIPSMVSLFTSLYVRQHGVDLAGKVLNPLAITLPEVLRAAGYTTATFFANGFAHQEEFGFEEAYGALPPADPYRISPLYPGPFLTKRLMRDVLSLSLRVTFPPDERWYQDGARMNSAVRKWLDRRPAAPILLHVHYLDPHDPYFEHPLRRVQFDPRAAWNRDRLLARYDGEIHFVDERIAELLTALERGGYLENAIIAVAADHGEEFLDHGGWGHRHELYQELLRVPLVMVAPGRLPAGVVSDAPVQLVDLAPTLLELAGVAVPATFEGRSLVPITPDGGGEREALAELTTTVEDRQTLIVGSWKLIRAMDGSGEHTRWRRLFDLASDPAEQHDLAAERPIVADRLESRLVARLAELGDRALPASSTELSPEQLDQMRALGYVE